jgi:ATP-binding cassette, subfamily B, bacterial
MGEREPSILRVLTPHIADDSRRLGAVGVALAAAAALPLAGPLIIGRLIDRAQQRAELSELVQLGVLYLAIGIVAQVVTVLATRAATAAAWKATNRLRLGLTDHVLGLDHGFHRAHTPGELIQRIEGDLSALAQFLSKICTKLFAGAILIVGMIVVLGVIEPIIAPIVLAYLALSMTALWKVKDRAGREAAAEQGAWARFYGGVEEQLTALEDLRANGGRNYVIDRFQDDSRAGMRVGLVRQRASMWVWTTLTGTTTIGQVGSLALGALLVRADALSLGTAFTMYQYVNLLNRPLHDIIDQLDVVQKANGASRRVAELLSHQSDIDDSGALSLPPGPLSIEFRNVSFRYDDADGALNDDLNIDVDNDITDVDTANRNDDGSDLILDSISLVVPAGTRLGVVGRTGGGKTTLGRQLLRLVEPTSGTVLLSGVPLADIVTDEFRRRVALVPQDVHLLSGTVRDNVTLFDTSKTDDDARHALRSVGLDDLADDLDRDLSLADSLSAGEAQLLALARVWLRNPDLIVLDEATSRVDPATEQRIERAVNELLRGRTAVVIAHRLSTLASMDAIAVIDRGQIIEHGPRTELAASGGRYARLLTIASGGDASLDDLMGDELASASGGAP